MPNRKHFVLILISSLFFLVSCGDDSSSDRSHVEFNFYTVGSGDINTRFGTDIYQALDSLTDQEKEMLRNLDWISGDRLLVPIVKAGTIKSLWPTMENIGKDAAEVAFAKFTDITDSYNKSTYSKFLDNDEDYIQVLIHSLFGLTIEHLVRSGTVSQIPETVPESFGVYFVFGKLF